MCKTVQYLACTNPMEVSAGRYAEMKVQAFLLLAKTFRSNPGQMLDKAQLLKKVAAALGLRRRTFYEALCMLRGQTQLNVATELRQFRENS